MCALIVIALSHCVYSFGCSRGVCAAVLLRAAERSILYLLYCAASYVLCTVSPDLFPLMMLRMELKLFWMHTASFLGEIL